MGYSLLVDMQFPEATESLQLSSAYQHLFHGGDLSSTSRNKECDPKNGSIYFASDVCWFDTEYTYTEPAYPDWSVMVSHMPYMNGAVSFYGVHVTYSPYTSKLPVFETWHKSVRIYIHRNISSAGVSYNSDDKLNQYREVGFNFNLPNIYENTPVSHEVEIAYAHLARRPPNHNLFLDVAEAGGYLGLNTNIDVLRTKLTVGLGWFFPKNELSESMLKMQIMAGWTFGVVGGGPLNRWKE